MTAKDIDKSCPPSERWQEHVGRCGSTAARKHSASPPPPEGHDMSNKIEIRPLDKKETTSDSGGNGGA
ncbi:hypothetical protein ACH4ZX_05600 [Streptomyces sp. NPDC020490]|uniref:hypothetical protein n=1 Tax=Streptomyces sp. NPDC020490 TaxID=3365078 RepID=UPI00379FC926